MHRSARIAAAAAAAAIAAFAAPTAASADSIVYIDGGNVWSASPDGSKKVQLTDGGNWHSPTQADDGTVAAVQGTGPIHVMGRDGKPIRSITTAMAPTSNGGLFAARPIQLSFSPDGSKIAYAYAGHSCPVASTCDPGQVSTFYTAADVAEATPQAVYGNQFGVANPEWISNDRALVFGGAGSQVSIDPIGGGDYSFKPWMVPDHDLGDGELSRDGRRLVTTMDYGTNLRLAFYVVRGDAKTELTPDYPEIACDTSRDASWSDPTWSPDGTGVAAQSKEGIEVFRFTELAPNHCVAGGPFVLSPTGSSPDWGPADAPAARYVAPGSKDSDVVGGQVGRGGSAAGSGGGLGGDSGGGPAASNKPMPRIASSTKIKRSALRAGLSVKVDVPAAGKVTVRVKHRGRTVVQRTVSVKRAGVVTVKLPKVSAAKAAKVRGAGVTVEVSAAGATASSPVTIR